MHIFLVLMSTLKINYILRWGSSKTCSRRLAVLLGSRNDTSDCNLEEIYPIYTQVFLPANKILPIIQEKIVLHLWITFMDG